MKTVAMILELAAPLQAGFHIRIENEPWMTLVIEDTQERGPNGLPAISVTHYGEQNGDLMRDPEMIFEAEECSKGMNLVPYYWRNEYAGIEQYSDANLLNVSLYVVQRSSSVILGRSAPRMR
jgi:hypothetical protein